MPPTPRLYVSRYSEMTKSSANHAVANFLIRLDWSFFMSARMRIAPSAGSQVIKERIGKLVIRSLARLLNCRKNIPQIEKCDRDHQPQHHHERVVLCETGLRSTEQRRHQTHDERRDRIDESVDEIFVERADDATEQPAQRCETVYDPVDEF